MKFLLFAAMFFLVISCTKSTNDPTVKIVRKIQFSLYTDKDFSDNNGTITFTVSIRNANATLWDSVFAPMKIKEIPDSTHKIIIEKTITDDTASLLKAGFLYSIENVGNSWYWDTLSASETYKKVDFNFQ